MKGIHSKAAVKWNFQAPEDAGDTHYSIVKGSKANVIIRQGKEQNYRTELYVEATAGTSMDEFSKAMGKTIAELQRKYPDVTYSQKGPACHVMIPDKYRIGHEAHFREVTKRYLKYLAEGKLPKWEVSNMKAKYNITTEALELANR